VKRLLVSVVALGIALAPALFHQAGTTAQGAGPKSIAFSYSGNVGPHDPAIRFEYVVPPGRKATIETIYIAIELETDVTCCANTSTETIISLAPASTGQFSSIVPVHIWHSLQAGTKEVVNYAPHRRLWPGDRIKGVTVNLKSDGTVLHSMFVTLTEEDL
jgi:hypothetical protein